jgi:hypothetical protein
MRPFSLLATSGEDLVTGTGHADALDRFWRLESFSAQP